VWGGGKKKVLYLLINIGNKVLNRLGIIALTCLFFAPFLKAKERDAYSFVDNMALKTNAFEWLITVPNFGFEYDVVRTTYQKMTLGLTAKYNWNSYHKLTPSTAFDLLDVRPEFRYYLRADANSRKTEKPWWGKMTRRWWAMYIGPYLSYGNYTFKLAPQGIHGYSFGAGVSVGYAAPLYEYNKGAVDIEFGFSLGLQGCTRDVFTYNPEGYYYMKVPEKSKDLHFTPFPVVSELRVAFVWRKQSIAHQVKIYEQKANYLHKKKTSVDKYIKRSIPEYINESFFHDGRKLRDMIDVVTDLETICARDLDTNAIVQFDAEMSGVKSKYMATLDGVDSVRFEKSYQQTRDQLRKKAGKERDRLTDKYLKLCTTSAYQKQVTEQFAEIILDVLTDSMIFTPDGKNVKDSLDFQANLDFKCEERLKKEEIRTVYKNFAFLRNIRLKRPAAKDTARFAAFRQTWFNLRGKEKDSSALTHEFDKKFGWYLSSFNQKDSAEFMKLDSLLKVKLADMVEKRRNELVAAHCSKETLMKLEDASLARHRAEIEKVLPLTLLYSEGNLREAREFHNDVNNRCDVLLNKERYAQTEAELEAIRAKYPPVRTKQDNKRLDYIDSQVLKLKGEAEKARDNLVRMYMQKRHEASGRTQ